MGSGCSNEANHRSSGLSSATSSRASSSTEIGVGPHSCTTNESHGPVSETPQSMATALETRGPPPQEKHHRRTVPASYEVDVVSDANPPRSSSILPPPPPYVPIARKTDVAERLLLKQEDHGSLISADAVLFSNVKRSSPHLSDGPTPPMEEPLVVPRTSDSDASMDAMRPLDGADELACNSGSVPTQNSALNLSDDCTSLAEGKRGVREDFPFEFPAPVHREVSPGAEEVTKSSQVSPYSESSSLPERLSTLSTTQI